MATNIENVSKTIGSQLGFLVALNLLKTRADKSSSSDNAVTRTFSDVVRDGLSRAYDLVKLSLFVSISAYIASFGLTPVQWSVWIFNVMNIIFIKVPYYMIVGLFKPIDFVMEGGKRH